MTRIHVDFYPEYSLQNEPDANYAGLFVGYNVDCKDVVKVVLALSA